MNKSLTKRSNPFNIMDSFFGDWTSTLGLYNPYGLNFDSKSFFGSPVVSWRRTEEGSLSFELAAVGIKKENIEATATNDSIAIKGDGELNGYNNLNYEYKDPSFDFTKAQVRVENGIISVFVPPAVEKKKVQLKIE